MMLPNESKKKLEITSERSSLLLLEPTSWTSKVAATSRSWRKVTLWMFGLAMMFVAVVCCRYMSKSTSMRSVASSISGEHVRADAATSLLSSMTSKSSISTTTIDATTALKGERNDKHRIKCDDIMIGVWVETCFIVSEQEPSNNDHGDVVFPGQQGILSFPIIVIPAKDGGTNLYGYSVKDPFFGGKSYWELGHGMPSRVAFATPTTHCVAKFKSKLIVANDDDDDDNEITDKDGWDNVTTIDNDGDYYWNWIAHDIVVAGNGRDAACQFKRLSGSTCREVRETAISRFALVNVTSLYSVLPSESDLCG